MYAHEIKELDNAVDCQPAGLPPKSQKIIHVHTTQSVQHQPEPESQSGSHITRSAILTHPINAREGQLLHIGVN